MTEFLKSWADQIAARDSEQEFISALRSTVKETWAKACEHDKIEQATAKFAIFSAGNQFEKLYNAAMCEYLAACRQYQAGERITRGRSI